MGIIYYLNKLTPGLYYKHEGRDGLINWDSDINALQFSSSSSEEFDNHFIFEFADLTFAFFSNYKFYANVNKQKTANFREVFSEPIDKSCLSDIIDKLEKYLGKPTSIGFNNFPSWSYYKICLKLIDFNNVFRISITSESPVHDYRNETKVLKKYNQGEIIFIPNVSFSFDNITSMDLKKFIDESLTPNNFRFQFDWFGEYEKGTLIKDNILIDIDVTDGYYSFNINNKLNEVDLEKAENWINYIVNYLLKENSKDDRYNILRNITEEQ